MWNSMNKILNRYSKNAHGKICICTFHLQWFPLYFFFIRTVHLIMRLIEVLFPFYSISLEYNISLFCTAVFFLPCWNACTRINRIEFYSIGISWKIPEQSKWLRILSVSLLHDDDENSIRIVRGFCGILPCLYFTHSKNEWRLWQLLRLSHQ